LLEGLRQSSDDQAAIVKNDLAVKDLQATLAWYQNEAVKLSDACSRLQSRYDKVRTKIKNFAIENNYLEQQAKMLIRQNQTLKSNLEKESSKSLKPTPLPSITFTSTFPKSPEITLPKPQSPQDPFIPFLEELQYDYPQQSPQFFKSTNILLKNLNTQHSQEIISINGDISQFKSQIHRHSAIQSEVFLKKNESEELFLECVDEMRKEIIRKKAKTCSVKRAGVIKPDTFMISEREKLVESFVTNEEIISFLYEKLFGMYSESSEQNFGHTLGYALQRGSHPIAPVKRTQTHMKTGEKQAIVVKGKLMISRN
jgi:predicted nuclease with TOPRIM domain